MFVAGAAHAQDACRTIEGQSTWSEWLEGSEPRGARLLIRDTRWSWTGARAGAVIFCPSCPAGDIAKGVLRIGLAPFSPAEDKLLREELRLPWASRLEFALHPQVIGAGLSGMVNFTFRAVTPVTDPLPVSLVGLNGMARAIAINSAGNVLHGVAVALEERCFALWGVFFREDNGPVAIDDLRQVDAAVVLHRYTPAFTPAQLGPRGTVVPWREFPLGAAREQWGDEQRHQQQQQQRR